MDRDSSRRLMTGAIDYAGLFPPAGLSMAAAVVEYDAAQHGPDAWMLGRFVVPAARLSELAAARLDPAHTFPAAISAIVTPGSGEDLTAVRGFNAGAARHGALVDAIECRPGKVTDLDWLLDQFRESFDIYVEVPTLTDTPAWIEQIAARGLRAKVRTGGLAAEAFPAPDALLAFLEAAVLRCVPFKATAGLHHATRGTYALTYDAASLRAPMYGYLNVLLATAALSGGLPAERARALLTASDAASLVVDDEGVRWGGVTIPAAVLDATRKRHFMSFGSCSFREPADEYRALVAATANA